MDKLVIIDGHAFAFRAYFAFGASNLTNSITGKPSGAFFGFFKMLIKIIQDFKPSHLIITFDPGTRLKRNDIYEDYKKTRSPMPEDLRPQLGEIEKFLEIMKFPIIKIAGEEADDVIGTLCELYAKKSKNILIFSGDKDLFQLLDFSNIKMYRGKKGATDFIVIDKVWVKDNLGIECTQIIDYMGIVGDTSDNIPGVKGIGEKGASKLLNDFKNLEEIYDNLSSIKNKSLHEKLSSNKEKAFLSRKLATLNRSIPLKFKESDFLTPDFSTEEVILSFKKAGYNVLSADLAKIGGKEEILKNFKLQDAENKKLSGNYKLIQTEDELKKIARGLSVSKILSVDTETTSPNPVEAEILGISFCNEEKTGFYIPIQHPDSKFNKTSFSIEKIHEYLKPILENPKIKKVGQNIKYDSIVLHNIGIKLQPIYFDTMLASYVLFPEGKKHNMDALALEYLGYTTIKYSDLVGSGKTQKKLTEIELEKVSDYAAEDADITFRLYNKLKVDINADKNLQSIFHDLEVPLIEVLQTMELNGVKIDEQYFQNLSDEYSKEIESTEKKIQSFSSYPFNIASTKDLQKVLFEDLNLPIVKKNKTGLSTDQGVLEELQDYHPIINLILLYRKYTKLKSTYIDSLPKMVNPKTKRIHTSYNQTIAATGRLSSINPNLQNIPIKDEDGRRIRTGFIPENKNFEFLSLDYSQIELRIMAHYSNDPTMIQAYHKNLDIHKQTAASIFNVTEKKVDSEMRNKAKVVNFSVIYGITPFGLAKSLRVNRNDAKMFIDKYFELYPGVKNFMDSIVEEGKEKGYVETLFGRRRFVPDLKSKNKLLFEAARRIAINSPVQGTSADMIKLAMIKIHSNMKSKNFKSKLVLQVHDELIFEVEKSEKEAVLNLAKPIMENIIPLQVPILVGYDFGKNWGGIH